jgi:predicted ribosome quality control (RQC) complex YloA/Tae2 family protein
MKESMSNTDIRAIMPEIKEVGQGAFVNNVYQYNGIFVLKVHKTTVGTRQILIEPGRRIHVTRYRRDAPRFPPEFCMVLRKYLRNRVITNIEQYDLDRIVVFEVGNDENKYKLIVELFGKGNVVLVDPDDEIFVGLYYKKMRDRNVVPNATYQFPPQRGRDILAVELQDLEDVIEDSNASLIRTLTRGFNVDSLSCEEVCALAGISPTEPSQNVTENQIRDMMYGFKEYLGKIEKGADEPRIVLDDEGQYLSFVPFKFETYAGMSEEVFDTYSQAIDEFFGFPELEKEIDKKQAALREEKERLETIIEKQKENLDELEEEASLLRETGEAMYANFQEINEILHTVEQARSDGVPWARIQEKIEEGKKKGIPSAEMITEIHPERGEVILEVDGKTTSLDIRKSVQQNASKLYNRAKKIEGKMKGARQQIEKTRKELENLDESEIEPMEEQKPVKVRRKHWYEKYRWFKSSEGHLVLGGRDAKTNEELAKKHLGPNDVFIHAAVHGAPYVIIKVPDEQPGDITLREAGKFSITFSKAWQENLVSADAYWVEPNQVSFSPPSGEYLPSGAVMIYGSKNYIENIAIELAVGLLFEGEHAVPMSGPYSAVESHTEFNIKVGPGRQKKSNLVKSIMHRFEEMLPKEKARILSRTPEQEIMRVLPPGEGHILE